MIALPFIPTLGQLRKSFPGVAILSVCGLLAPQSLAADPEAAPAAQVDPGDDRTFIPSPDRPRAGAIMRGWQTDTERWFLSARADLGFLFFRPRASVGYGIPHQAWAGIDWVPILSSTQVGSYMGIRYRLPQFEIRTGALYAHAFYRGFLPPQGSFDSRDLGTHGEPRAQYWGSDSELTLSLHLGGGHLVSETQAIVLPGLSGDQYVFVETLGVVVAPPWAIRQQLRYTLAVPGVEGLFIGPTVEAVYVHERDQKWVLRGGATLRFWLYQDLQLRTDFVPTFFSPDTFGRDGAAWLTINARFMWATD